MLPLIAGAASKLLLPAAKKKVSGEKMASAIVKKKPKESTAETKQPTAIVKKVSVTKLLDLKLPDTDTKAQVAQKTGDSEFSEVDNVMDRIDEILSDIRNTVTETNTFKKKELSKDQKDKKKRQREEREETLERKPRTFGLGKPKIKVPNIPFLDAMSRYFGSILIGSLVMFLINKYEEIVKFVTNTFDKIKEFFKSLEPIFTPIWNGLKWIVGEGTKLVAKIIGIPEADTNPIEKNLLEIMKQIPIIGNLFKGIEDFVKSLKGEAPSTQPTTQSTQSGDLFEIIAGGEGGYNSVNRGNAGDTPGGAQSVFGKPLTEMTVGEVVDAQQTGKVFAVGKYQIIPDTMTGFLRQMKIPRSAKFDAATQEKFKEYVINFKRPEVGKYIRGESSNRAEAAQELAREFASVGLSYSEAGRQRGESRYSGTAGNRASIAPEAVEAALDRARSGGGVSVPTPVTPAPAPAPAQPVITPPSVAETIPSINQQTEYEKPYESSTVVPLPAGDSTPNVVAGNQGMIIPIGMSKIDVLNSYHQAQLTGFLYKQG